MEDAAVVSVPESPINRSEPVAGAVHTFFLLVILGAVAVLGYYSLHYQGGGRQPNHLFTYLATIAWEWLLVGFVYWGLRRRGKTMRNIAGRSWRSASDFFIDIAVAFGFWIVAIIVLSLVARAVGANGMSQAARLLAPQGALESLVWIALAVTAGICEEIIFRGYLKRQFVA